VKEEILAS